MKTDIYYKTKAISYGMSAGRMKHILDLLPGKPSAVLDIGCAGGTLAQTLKERGYRVWGVDISDEAIRSASPYLEQGFAFDVTDEYWPEELMGKKFDVVIASEIIEHLFEPEQFLKKLHRILAPNGSIIITTPNFLFWKNRLRMLMGKFKYEQQGLLDFGHIRFFTLDTARQAFKNTGFKIIKEHHYYPNLEHRGIEELGQYLPRIFAYQFIFKIT